MANSRTIKALFSSKSSKLHSLVSHAQQLAQLNQILQSLLSMPLKGHVIIANTTHDTLIINVDSAVWLTKTRLQLPEIFDKFKKLSGLTTLRDSKIKINPYMLYGYSAARPADTNGKNNRNQPTPAAVHPRSASDKTLSQISNVANNLQDPELKKALLNLANTLANNQR